LILLIKPYISASSSSSHDLKPIDDGLHSMRAQFILRAPREQSERGQAIALATPTTRAVT
jgi:hypothetical protein